MNFELDRCCPTRKGYNIITTFDRRRYSYKPGHNHGDSWTVLPNVPMRADKTLLAEILTKGRLWRSGIGIKMRRTNTAPRRKSYSQIVKQSDKFVGRLVGVEIEYYPEKYVEKFHDLENLGSDASLGDGGRELRRLSWVGAGGRLHGVLSLGLHGTVDERCGLHVHVDARHLGQDGKLGPTHTYERVIQFYPFLKKLVPQNRHTNKYCRWKNNCAWSASFELDSRWAAINFMSYEEHKTLEFRCQGGMTNPETIESWALLCRFLVNYAAIKENPIPTSWRGFLNILPEDLKTWSFLRKQKLYGDKAEVTKTEVETVTP